MISYTGLYETSKGYQVVKTMSWFAHMCMVDCTPWNTYMKRTRRFTTVWTRWTLPAIVTRPVAGSLAGISSHVKDSVKWIRCSSLSLLNLKQINSTWKPHQQDRCTGCDWIFCTNFQGSKVGWGGGNLRQGSVVRNVSFIPNSAPRHAEMLECGQWSLCLPFVSALVN